MFSVLQFLGDLRRLSQIVTALFKAGFSIFLRQIRLGWYVGLWCRIKCLFHRVRCPPENSAKKLRETFELLGPTFMKLGQVLSMRPDIIPEAYVKEFSRLQDQAPSFPFSIVKSTVENELGKALHQIFRDFDEKPIASASLGQVHIGRLISGKKVAVKIQRPGVRKILEKDLRIMNFILKKIEDYVPEVRPLRLEKALETFTASLWKELDYEVEGRHADRFAYLFRDDPGIKIPKIYWSNTTTKVLCMEFIEGIKMGDHEAIRKQGLNHKKLMDNCVRACLTPVFSFGFFHADPHPGNVWALKDNRVCYLDFGMMGSISKTLRLQMLFFMYFMIQENVASALYYLLQMTEKDKAADIDGYSEEVTDMMISFLQQRKENTETISTTFYTIIVKGMAYRVYFPSSLVMLAKAMVTGESMCRMTHDRFDYLDVAKPIIEKVYQEEFGLSALFSEYQKFVPDLLQFVKKLPSMLQMK
jgi:ubiquinone biosynthesis protein